MFKTPGSRANKRRTNKPLVYTKTFDQVGTFKFNIPPGYGPQSFIVFEAWGGGGGGARSNTSVINACCGGSGATYTRRIMNLSSLPNTIIITVGAGGNAISSGNTNQNGNHGSNSTIAAANGLTYLTGYRGLGGLVGNTDTRNGVSGAGPLAVPAAGSLSGAEPQTRVLVSTGQYSAGTDSSSTDPTARSGFIWAGGGSGGCDNGNGSQLLVYDGGGSIWGGGGGGGSQTTTGGSIGGISIMGGDGGDGDVISFHGTSDGQQPGGGGGSRSGNVTANSGAGGNGMVIVTLWNVDTVRQGTARNPGTT